MTYIITKLYSTTNFSKWSNSINEVIQSTENNLMGFNHYNFQQHNNLVGVNQ
jgi:hypothetical protein